MSANKIYNKGVIIEDITYTPDTEASGWAGIEKGDVISIGNMIAIAVKDFVEASDSSIALIIKSNYVIGTKTAGTGTAITAGSNVYVTVATGLISTTASGNQLIGVCKKDAADGDTEVYMTYDGQIHNLD